MTQSAPPPLGLALVGPGAIAADHLRAFAAVGGTRNAWVIGRTPHTLPVFADEWGFVRHGTELVDALADPAVDLVVICSPNAMHAAQAERALRAGKHVIVEIPMALSYREAVSLVALADEVGRSLQVCHTMRSFESIAHLRRMVADGEESVSQIVGFFGIPRRNNQGFSGQRSWIDDLLWHHACHLVDASLWVTGRQPTGGARLLRGRAHPEFDMTLDLSLAFATDAGQIVTHALTYNTSTLTWQIRFVGDAGEYLFDHGRLLDSGGAVLVDGAPIRDLTLQNHAMLRALSSGVPGDFDARTALPTMRLLQELHDSDPNPLLAQEGSHS